MGTVRDWLDLFRAGNCVSGLVGVFLGAILTLEEFPTNDNLKITSLLGLSVYSFMASWNALNDYLDLEIDKINRPDRPLPSERISKSLAITAIIFTCLISVISLFLAGQIANNMTDNFADWYPTIVIWLIALGLLINYEDDRILLGLKNKGLPGNLAISISVGLVVLFGAAGLFDPFNGRAVSLFVIGTLYNLSREIIKDVEDMEGDLGRFTFAMRVGAERARLVSWSILLLTLVALLTPFVIGIFDELKLILLTPGMFTLLSVKKHIVLEEDTAASRMIKISMILTMLGLILAALI